MSQILPSSLRSRLRALTPARVGLGRTGVSQQTRDTLDFQCAHAQARDAVHARMETAAMVAAFGQISASPVLRLHSAATDRTVYLQRPDLGRKLDAASRNLLAGFEPGSCGLALVVADGLSALAVERHAVPLLAQLLPQLQDWRLAPLSVVEQGRVAIGDEIGSANVPGSVRPTRWAPTSPGNRAPAAPMPSETASPTFASRASAMCRLPRNWSSISPRRAAVSSPAWRSRMKLHCLGRADRT
jgi:ethanolamine ammonia-lyase small subunit